MIDKHSQQREPDAMGMLSEHRPVYTSDGLIPVGIPDALMAVVHKSLEISLPDSARIYTPITARGASPKMFGFV